MSHAIRLAVAGTVLLVAALAAWSVSADPPETAEHRTRITAMSQAERDRLRRAAEEFERMPSAEQEAIRVLHNAVEEDPSLKQTLLNYDSFLSNLQPWDREDLRQETDPEKRIDRIKKLIAERSPPESPGRPPWFARRFVEGPVLHGPLLDQAMNQLLDALDLPASQKEAIREIQPDHVRHLEIARKAKPKLEPGRPGPPWPSDEVIKELLGLLPNDKFKGWLLRDDSKDDRGDRERGRWFRRSVAIGLVTRSLLAEWHGIAARQIPREMLHEAYEALPEDQRRELAGRSLGELVRVAIRDEISKRTDDLGRFAKDFSEVADLRRRFDPLAGEPGDRRDPGPPFGGPRGDGRRGDGPERRGGPGRGGPPREDRDRGPDDGEPRRDGPGGPPPE